VAGRALKITFSSPIFSFFPTYIYCVCCNRELADCENIAFLTANADSTKKSRRHPVGGLPSSRLLKGRGSVIPGDESTLGGEEEEEKEM